MSSSDTCCQQKVVESIEPAPVVEGFYRRPLPTSTCIAFDSASGKRLFKEALGDGTMEVYFSLAANFVTQNDPATCGLGTLSMVLNSLELDPDRIWKGSWRWYSEEMLDCCSPLEVVRLEGLTLDDFACEARCNGAKASVTRLLNPEGDVDVAKFRDDVKEVCKSSEKKLVISYNRSTLLQTGTGHFSPIGGYHEKSDHVLILDVARFKYPPHWVPLPLLVKSMSTIDPVTGLTRGYVVMSKSSQQMSAVLRVSVGRSQWKQFADAYRATFQFRLKKAEHQYISIEQYVEMACKIIVEVQIMEYLVAYVESFDALAEEHRNYIETVFSQIAKTKLMQAISSLPKPCCPSYSKHGYKEIATIFILAQGPIGLDILDESMNSGSATDPSMNGTTTHPNGSDATSDSECALKNSQNARKSMKSTIEELRSIFDEVLPEHMSNEVSALRSTLRAIERSCACRIQAETDPSNPNRGCRQ